MNISLKKNSSNTLIKRKVIQDIMPYLPISLRNEISGLPEKNLQHLEEIRFRQTYPIALRFSNEEAYLAENSMLTKNFSQGRVLSPDELNQIVLLISNSSFYALEEELRRGYITLPGGHRAGLCGRAVLDNGSIRTIKEISSINLRIAHFVEGNAQLLLPALFVGDPCKLQHTLIVSAPRGGKTTLLRDLACVLGGRDENYSYNVGIVDERSEISAMRNGIPQLPIGPRCDVLDACPKAEGMMLMIRSMAPQVLICDEIGRKEDAYAIQEAVNAGIVVIASAHGSNKEEISQRPVIGDLLADKSFGRIVFLSRRNGPGTIESVLNASLEPVDEFGKGSGVNA